MTAPGTTTTDTGKPDEVTDPAKAAETKADDKDKLPDDHPLVKAFAAQKTEIKDLKVRVKKLDDIEEAAKSEAEKTADRIAKAEAEAATVPEKVAAALKVHLVALHQIDKDDAELFLTADEPELLLKQVARLLERPGARKKHIVTREGETPESAPTSDMQEFTRQLFNKGD